jgi:hypothetical protein
MLTQHGGVQGTCLFLSAVASTTRAVLASPVLCIYLAVLPNDPGNKLARVSPITQRISSSVNPAAVATFAAIADAGFCCCCCAEA